MELFRSAISFKRISCLVRLAEHIAVTNVMLRKGDIVRLETSGGGGFGEPKMRLAEQVERISHFDPTEIWGLNHPLRPVVCSFSPVARPQSARL
jgi:hypothetical protein